MATRHQVHKQKIALSQYLRDGCRTGRLRAGEPAPPLRELAESYSISKNVVNQVLLNLVDEGLFHTIPRVGTFVGQPTASAGDVYLLLLPDNIGLIRKINLQLTQQGFEERITERGSVSMALPLREVVRLRERGELPRLAGIYDLAYHADDEITWGIDRTVARVGFSGRIEDTEYSDVVSYDDHDGGRRATQHLLRLGHRRIAFLALHSSGGVGEENEMIWSRQREDGWREAMSQADLSCDGLAFYPGRDINRYDLMNWISEPALALLQQPGITAVVAANDSAALNLLAAGREKSQLSRRQWPAVVGFDNLADAATHSLSSLRLPAEQIGHAAADLLWERHHGHLTGPPQQRRVAMRLISRLTSSRDWSFISTQATSEVVRSDAVLTTY